MSHNPQFAEIMHAAAEAHRIHEVLANSDLLVNGQLLLTEPACRKLREDCATPEAEAAQFWQHGFTIPVVVIPDDGATHDVGAGKVAIVSPLDHATIFVFPADLGTFPGFTYHGNLGDAGIER